MDHSICVPAGWLVSRAQSLLIAVLLMLGSVAAGLGAEPATPGVRLLFTGDILLARQVQVEIERTGRFPWEGWEELFGNADWVVGNLEGAVGTPQECVTAAEVRPCFAIPPNFIGLLRQAGFRAMGMANNHGGDLGRTGRDATRRELSRQGLSALSLEDSPLFVRLGPTTIGVVAFCTVPGRDGPNWAVPSPDLRQKLRLARRLANVVIAYVHWGSELLDWPDASQRRTAAWLIRQGVDVVIGHHPHVVQTPECVLGKPVFYSLGNHLFDQKYAATKEGLIAECRIADGNVACSGIATKTPVGSAFPRLAGETEYTARSNAGSSVLGACRSAPAAGITVHGVTLRPGPAEAAGGGGGMVLEALRDGQVKWRTRPVPLVAIEAGRLAGEQGPEFLFTLERHPSSLDQENGLRPYVYEVGARGLMARWRGTALAWPVIDAMLLADAPGVMCALHRGDSFLVPQPDTSRTRVAAYRWNGFGFSGVDDPQVYQRCCASFEMDGGAGQGNIICLPQ
jgi:hypothetical protein